MPFFCEAKRGPLFEYEVVLGAQNKSYVLKSPGKKSGMFSVFSTVLGFLDFYDHQECTGIKIDFQEKGLYFDPKRGKNWWSYYFETDSFGKTEGVFLNRVPRRWKRKFTKQGSGKFSRKKAHRLITKYIRVRPDIYQEFLNFKKDHFSNTLTIGVHYRGTNKKLPLGVPYETIFEAIESYLESVKNSEYKIFVATDEFAFLEEIKKRYKEKVIFTSAFRSKDGQPVHLKYKNSYETGRQALIDCLLLSQTDILFRTPSNLSRCSGYFNPELPVVDLY
jgi:hypothetical protein